MGLYHPTYRGHWKKQQCAGAFIDQQATGVFIDQQAKEIDGHIVRKPILAWFDISIHPSKSTWEP